VVPGTAGEGLVETEVVVFAGDRLVVSATGEVCFHPGDTNSCVGPDGMDRAMFRSLFPREAASCTDELIGSPHAGLFVEINDVKTYVGESATMPITRSGNVSLGVNDCSGTGRYGNEGSYTVNLFVDVSEAE